MASSAFLFSNLIKQQCFFDDDSLVIDICTFPLHLARSKRVKVIKPLDPSLITRVSARACQAFSTPTEIRFRPIPMAPVKAPIPTFNSFEILQSLRENVQLDDKQQPNRPQQSSRHAGKHKQARLVTSAKVNNAYQPLSNLSDNPSWTQSIVGLL